MKNERNNIVHLRPVVPLDEEQVVSNKNKKKLYKKYGMIGIAVMGIVVGIWGLYMHMTTFTNIQIVQVFEDISVENSSTQVFASGFLKYGKDGAAYINGDGESIWNHPYEMSTPIVLVMNESAVIADSGGNQIVVVDAEGIKGEFETYLPIEKVTVSGQGIVAVLMYDGASPQVVCYDAVGNILVEHKVSITETGYPVGLALSEDGQVLLITYLQVTETGFTSNYRYYSFSDNELGTENIIASGSEEGVVISQVQFLDSNTSVLISDKSMLIFEGVDTPVSVKEVNFVTTIESVFWGDGQLGLLLETSEENQRELRVYDDKGDVIISVQVDEEFQAADIVNQQVVVYGGEKCIIYSQNGVEKFNGVMGVELECVFPTSGMNKYILIGSDGMEEIRLVR